MTIVRRRAKSAQTHLRGTRLSQGCHVERSVNYAAQKIAIVLRKKCRPQSE